MLHSTQTPTTTPDPLDELEDYLSQSKSSSISLDDLLCESLAERKTTESVKAARQLLAGSTKLSSDEREAIQQSVRSWEVKREWLPQASVVMFSRQQCQGCGEFHKTFLGFFQRQTHKHTKVDRWIASTKPTDTSLARESKYQDSHCELCEDCAELMGYDVEES